MTSAVTEQLVVTITLALRESALLIADVSPWILAGALIGAAMRTIRKVPFMGVLSRLKPRAAIPLASVSGAASPLCTLGSVPIVTGLVSEGFPKGAAVAFLASSSMVTPQIALMTAGFLGPRIAILQATGGIVAGTLAGFLCTLTTGKAASAFRDTPCNAVGIAPTSRSFFRHVADQLEYGLFWLVMGVIAAQVIGALINSGMIPFIPAKLPKGIGIDYTMDVSGTNGQGIRTTTGLIPALIGSLIAAPTYSCGGAALPVLAFLRSCGIDDAFFLAFLVSGPATRIRSIAALGKLLRPIPLIAYVTFIIAFSVLWAEFAARF